MNRCNVLWTSGVEKSGWGKLVKHEKSAYIAEKYCAYIFTN